MNADILAAPAAATPTAFAGTLPVDLAVLHEGIQRLDQGISIFDGDLALVTCNRRYQSLFALPDALTRAGTRLPDILRYLVEQGEYGPGAHDDLLNDVLQPYLNLTDRITFETRRPNGVHVETTAIALSASGFIATHTDISELKRREEDLRRSRMAMEVRMLERSEELRQRKAMEAELAEKSSWLKAAIDNIPGGMVLFDKELRYYLWTKDVHRMWDLPPDMLQVGLPYRDVLRYFAERGDFGPGDIGTLVETNLAPVRDRRSVHAVRQLPSGTVLDIRRNPLPNGGYVSIFQDITDAKQREADFSHQMETMRAAIDDLPSGVIILDRELQFTSWSRATEPLLEVPFGTLRVGSPYEEFLRYEAARGDFGAIETDSVVAERMAFLRSRQPVTAKNRTPSGLIVDSRARPLPSGGYLCTFTPSCA